MSQQIIKWCDAICYNEDEMHLGSYRTFKMIKDESIQLSQQIQHLEQQLAKAHKRGWEQGKREAEKVVEQSRLAVSPFHTIRSRIAAMEYGGKAND